MYLLNKYSMNENVSLIPGEIKYVSGGVWGLYSYWPTVYLIIFSQYAR